MGFYYEDEKLPGGGEIGLYQPKHPTRPWGLHGNEAAEELETLPGRTARVAVPLRKEKLYNAEGTENTEFRRGRGAEIGEQGLRGKKSRGF